MADKQLFANNAVSLLAAAIGPGATSLSVLPGMGALFPQPSAPGEYFLVTLENEAATTREIVRVTGRTGDTLTGLVRGQEGTTALSWGSSPGNDTLVDHRVTAQTMRLAMELPSTHFGPSSVGVVVPPSTTQPINVLDTSGLNRSCKWIMTITAADSRVSVIEVLAISRPLQPTDPMYTCYAKVGDQISYQVQVTGAPGSMTVQLSNNDVVALSVDVLRLQQHNA